jgi:hypothetical protein
MVHQSLPGAPFHPELSAAGSGCDTRAHHPQSSSGDQVPVVFWQADPADGVASEYGFTGLPEARTVSGGPLG